MIDWVLVKLVFSFLEIKLTYYTYFLYYSLDDSLKFHPLHFDLNTRANIVFHKIYLFHGIFIAERSFLL